MAKEKEVITVINNSVCHSVLMTALQFQLPSTVTRKANKIVMCTVLVKFFKYFFKRKKKEKKKEQEEKKRKKEKKKKQKYIHLHTLSTIKGYYPSIRNRSTSLQTATTEHLLIIPSYSVPQVQAHRCKHVGLGITHTCACINVSINVVALLLFLYSTLSVSVPLLMSQLCQCWNESTSKGEHNFISNIKYQKLFQGGKKGHIIFMNMIPWPTIWQCKQWSAEQQQNVCIQVLFIALLTKKCPECLLSLHVLPRNFMPLPVLCDGW